MAGTITHAFFAMDVYDKLDKNKKKTLKDYKNNLRTFAQGHDIFSFCNKNESHRFHTTDTRKFFINMIEYIEEKNLDKNPIVLSFLYGYICHYVLDKNIHPYVTYKAGIYKKGIKETYKYRCKHSDVETYIDSYFIREKEKIEPGKFKSHKFCLEPTNFSKELMELLDNTFIDTYNYKNASKYYMQGIKRMHILYFLLRNDKFKIKKFAYNTVDKITPKNMYKFRPISLSYEKNEKDYLNLDHKTWNNPKDKNEKYNTSVVDIYNNSIKEAISIINFVTDYFNNNKINLSSVFDNSSFSTGKDCNDKRKEKYFEN